MLTAGKSRVKVPFDLKDDIMVHEHVVLSVYGTICLHRLRSWVSSIHLRL